MHNEGCIVAAARASGCDKQLKAKPNEIQINSILIIAKPTQQAK